MILGITGPRPQNLFGFTENDPGNLFIIHAIKGFLEEHKPDKLITGMALGVDQWAAQWCMAMGIPFVAMLPSENPDSRWPDKSQKKFRHILGKAVDTQIAPNSGDESYAALLQKRNEMIVDAADEMLGIFGSGPGGTRNCLEYAKEQGKRIHIINPGDFYKSV